MTEIDAEARPTRRRSKNNGDSALPEFLPVRRPAVVVRMVPVDADRHGSLVECAADVTWPAGHRSELRTIRVHRAVGRRSPLTSTPVLSQPDVALHRNSTPNSLDLGMTPRCPGHRGVSTSPGAIALAATEAGPSVRSPEPAARCSTGCHRSTSAILGGSFWPLACPDRGHGLHIRAVSRRLMVVRWSYRRARNGLARRLLPRSRIS